MASWRGTSGSMPSENGPRAKCDQVIFEAMAKAAEVIVGSRCWIDNGGGPASPAASGSSRFNLLVPEIQRVRSILQRWKPSLHVPLRLDVYYQHSDQRRELLERWCLEYVPSHFQQQLDTLSSDPIVQLRFVCKKIVIWLRSLYCLCRMLPSQRLRGGTIGFSIYVVSEGNEDVNLLVTNQGFLSQRQPASVMTPYGELGWKVFYANKDTVNRLLPAKSPYRTQDGPVPQTRTMRIAIPTSQQQSQRQQLQQQQNQQYSAQFRPDGSPRVAHSAPQHGRYTYRRSHSAANADDAPRVMPTTNRSNSMANDQIEGITNNLSEELGATKIRSKDDNDVGPAPQKTLSGLSLAMMMSDENLEDSNDGEHVGGVMRKKPSAEQAEKRRAALHHAPPQLLPSVTMDSASPTTGPNSLQQQHHQHQQTSLVGAGEYGYGYNARIPVQIAKSPPGNTSTTAAAGYQNSNHQRQFLHADGNFERAGSPASFQVGTPPTGVLGATPPATGGFLGSATPPTVKLNSLIPPRASGNVAPPFVRPLGFVVDPAGPNAVTGTSSAVGTSTTGSTGTASEVGDLAACLGHRNSANSGPGTRAAPPMTSLDLLHSSPFQQAPGGSFVSSLSAHDHSNLNSILSSQVGSSLHPFEDHYDALHDTEDDMPFAVDDSVSPFQNSTAGSSALASSSAVASFAQRCAAGSRLSLFDSASKQKETPSESTTSDNDMVASLAEQLAEFKSFGASLGNISNASAGSKKSEAVSVGP